MPVWNTKSRNKFRLSGPGYPSLYREVARGKLVRNSFEPSKLRGPYSSPVSLSRPQISHRNKRQIALFSLSFPLSSFLFLTSSLSFFLFRSWNTNAVLNTRRASVFCGWIVGFVQRRKYNTPDACAREAAKLVAAWTTRLTCLAGPLPPVGLEWKYIETSRPSNAARARNADFYMYMEMWRCCFRLRGTGRRSRPRNIPGSPLPRIYFFPSVVHFNACSNRKHVGRIFLFSTSASFSLFLSLSFSLSCTSSEFFNALLYAQTLITRVLFPFCNASNAVK